MASIDDVAVQVWWDDECRKISEDFERLMIRARSAQTRYTEEISGKLGAFQDADELDNRAARGVPVSTKAQIVTWVSNVGAIVTAVEGTPGREEILSYPAVRSPL